MNMLRIRAAFAALAITILISSASAATSTSSPTSKLIPQGAPPPPASTITQFCFGDGSSGPCPCINSTPGFNQGCVNTSGSGGALNGTGLPSISSDSLLMTGTNLMPPNGAICIFVQGTATIARTPFGAGLRCFSGAISRIAVRPVIASTSQLGVPVTAMVSVLGGITSPGTYNYAVYYRDQATTACPFSFNITNGLKVVWIP